MLSAAAFLGTADAAANPLGMPGPDLYLVPFLVLAPAALIYLAFAFQKTGPRLRAERSRRGVEAVAWFTGLFAGVYLLGIHAWHSGVIAMAALAVIGLLATGCALNFHTKILRRAVLSAAIVSACILAAMQTPAIVSYRYYTFVDNDPIGGTNDTLTLLDTGMVMLEDGTVLRLDSGGKVHLRENTPASVEPLGDGRYRVSISAPAPGLTGKAIARFRRDTSAPFKVAREQVVHNNYQRFEFKEAVWVGEQRQKDVKLYNAARQEGCFPDEAVALLDVGGNPDAIIGSGLFPTAIFRAVALRCADVVAALIAAGADIELTNDVGLTPLLAAARKAEAHLPASTLIVRRLIAAGADLTAVDAQGNTVLHLAATKNVAATRAALDGGANAAALNHNQQTALQHAAGYYQQYGNGKEGERILALLRETVGKLD